MMKFSILIPVYNVEKYIGECLDSVLCQSYDNFEVILVDDGSTDSSGKICDEYAEKDSRIKVIHKENNGLISARRCAIKIADGDYCVFVDSDDKIKPELLQVVYEYINRYKADIVLYSFVYYDGKNTKSRNKKLFDDGCVLTGDRKKALYESYISGPDYYAIWTKCIKTSVLKSDPTDYEKYYSFNMSEDVLQSLYPITASERIVFADRELYLYRYNPDSVSHTMKADGIYKKNTSHVFSAMKEYLKLWDMNDKEHIFAVENSQFGYAMYTFTQYYKNVPKKDIKKVVDFDWDSFLPDNFSAESYSGETAKRLYKMIKKKDYLRLKWFFFKEKVYGKYKKMRGNSCKKS